MDADTLKAALTIAGTLASVIFGLVSWIASREIKRREDSEKELKENLQAAVEGLRQAAESERKERIRINEQIFSKLNNSITKMGDLDTTISSHRSDCQGVFLTTKEYDRMEKLKEKLEDQRKEQDRRMDQNIQNVTALLRTLIERTGRSRS